MSDFLADAKTFLVNKITNNGGVLPFSEMQNFKKDPNMNLNMLKNMFQAMVELRDAGTILVDSNNNQFTLP